MLTTINTRWEATQSVMAAKLTRLTHKVAIQLQLVAESCTICNSRSRRPVRKLLDAPLYDSEFYISISEVIVYIFSFVNDLFLNEFCRTMWYPFSSPPSCLRSVIQEERFSCYLILYNMCLCFLPPRRLVLSLVILQCLTLWECNCMLGVQHEPNNQFMKLFRTLARNRVQTS
jgi:hypothetical protein